MPELHLQPSLVYISTIQFTMLHASRLRHSQAELPLQRTYNCQSSIPSSYRVFFSNDDKLNMVDDAPDNLSMVDDAPCVCEFVGIMT